MALPSPLPDPLVGLIAERFRAMGEPTRIRILDLLRHGEASVQDLTLTLGSSQQNVSKHLALLTHAGIVARRRDGTHSYYGIADDSVFALCETVCGSIQHSIGSLAAAINIALDGAAATENRVSKDRVSKDRATKSRAAKDRAAKDQSTKDRATDERA
jgi:DNA-binding transcriptional ArsR family regulator